MIGVSSKITSIGPPTDAAEKKTGRERIFRVTV